MKFKFFKYFMLAMPASAILTGCISTPATEISSVPDCLAGSFSSQIHIISGENEFNANIIKSDKIWNAEFSQPSTLSGVELVFEDGMVSASYKGLAFSIPKDALPVQSALQNLILVSDNLEALNCETSDDEDSSTSDIKCTVENDLCSIKGNIDNGEFELITDKQGTPLTFTMENFSLTIEFSDFSKNTADETQNNDDTENISDDSIENTSDEITTENISETETSDN